MVFVDSSLGFELSPRTQLHLVRVHPRAPAQLELTMDPSDGPKHERLAIDPATVRVAILEGDDAVVLASVGERTAGLVLGLRGSSDPEALLTRLADPTHVHGETPTEPMSERLGSAESSVLP